MIKEVFIKDPENSTVKYLSGLKNFPEGRKFEFSPGINIIVGPNGSGKTTLLKILYDFTFTCDSPYSRTPNLSEQYSILEYDKFFRDSGSELKDGVQIKAYWAAMFFRYLPGSDLKPGSESKSIGNLRLHMSAASSSTGEGTMEGIDYLFSEMFGRKNYEFPLSELKRNKDYGNDYWAPRFENLLKYYKENNIDIQEKDFEFTVFMDEPDKNLDLENSKQVYGILSHRKEQTQIIAVIHNPVLIYKLSKLEDINFIEMEPGYIDEITKFVEEL